MVASESLPCLRAQGEFDGKFRLDSSLLRDCQFALRSTERIRRRRYFLLRVESRPIRASISPCLASSRVNCRSFAFGQKRKGVTVAETAPTVFAAVCCDLKFLALAASRPGPLQSRCRRIPAPQALASKMVTSA
jgi:hypothetical protein